MERRITRTKGKRYCTVEIGLRDGCLYITGENGCIVTPVRARRLAIEYWQTYFEEDSNFIHEMNERCGTHFRSARSAAKYVTRQNGEYHGLDATEVDGQVFLMQSCGCIHESIAKWFPEVKKLIPWHLNQLRAGCEHQEKLGWGKGFTVALTKHTLTAAQREVIQADLDRKYQDKIEKLFKTRWADILNSDFAAYHAIKAAFNKDHVTVYDMESLRMAHVVGGYNRNDISKKVEAWLKDELRKENPPEVFDHAVYEDSIGAPCPSCGTLYGHQWIKRELPEEIVNLAHTVLTNDVPCGCISCVNMTDGHKGEHLPNGREDINGTAISS